MTAPGPLTAALAWLASHRGIDRGEADVHAGQIQAHIDRLTTERDGVLRRTPDLRHVGVRLPGRRPPVAHARCRADGRGGARRKASVSAAKRWTERAEMSQPWVIYTYGRTHDNWWPIWSSTRFLGRARIGLECSVCGHAEVVSIRIPRFGPVPEPKSGRHHARERFLAAHAHPDRGHPMSWKRPLRNPSVFSAQGLDLDLLAMRLQADMDGQGGGE